MKKFKSHFRFTKQERRGVFFLLLIIVSLQVGYFLLVAHPFSENTNDVTIVDFETQSKIDALKKASAQKDSFKIYPFNPNYITDYKGYTLGMSIDEIDRLHVFRAQNKYVNSSEDFQKVTQVSDSLLKVLAPYFKFPEWTKNLKQSSVGSGAPPKRNKVGNSPEKPVVNFLDLNTATAEDLRSINGIGPTFSERIVKFRKVLGGFLVNEQLEDVYGLEPEVVQRVLRKFKVVSKPNVEKINLNKASVNEIAKLVYIKYGVAKEIVDYREKHGAINSFDELKDIVDFPFDKIDRIKLYLTL